MRRKTIAATLKRKADAWLSSIEDEELRADCKEHAFFAGGCITSMLLNEKPNDYDVYFDDFETCKAIATYYVDQFNASHKVTFKGTNKIEVPISVQDASTEETKRVRIYIKSAGIASISDSGEYEFFEADPDADAVRATEYVEAAMRAVEITHKGTKEDLRLYKPVFLTSNAITLSEEVQIVICFCDTPDKVVDEFDFAHTKNYFALKDDQLHLDKDAVVATLTKEIVYTGCPYPLSSMIRLRKFIQKGWSVNAGQMFKIAWDINHLNLDDMEVLQEQLVGADMAYFMEIVAKLREAKAKGITVDDAYLFEIVDQVF